MGDTHQNLGVLGEHLVDVDGLRLPRVADADFGDNILHIHPRARAARGVEARR